MFRVSAALLLALAAGAATSALANDTTAELSTGGLVFVTNDNIEMRSEDLAISSKEVSVRYRFFNKSQSNVTVLVAFPLPEIRIEEQDQNIAIPTEDPVNIFAFATTVNGAPVHMEVEQRVIAAGIDRTQLLKSLGIPLAPHLKATNDALDKLTHDKWEELLRVGLAEIEEYDIGQGMQKHLAARWGLQTTFYWQQTFAANAETAIEHHYKPSVGGSVQTSLTSPSMAKENEDYKRKYCIDAQLLTTLQRARAAAKAEFGAPYGEERIDYILKTGANWSGPIKDFRLVVDKGDASSLVSFCGTDVKKIGDTKFEMRKADFLPEGNLSVLILNKMPVQ